MGRLCYVLGRLCRDVVNYNLKIVCNKFKN